MRQGRYKHYKGKYYFVIGIAVHTETREEMVVYKQLYDSPGFAKNSLWVRSKSMFEEEIEINGKKVMRFVYVGAK